MIIKNIFKLMKRKEEIFEGEVIQRIEEDKVMEICTKVIDDMTFESVYVKVAEVEWYEFRSISNHARINRGDQVRVKGYNVTKKYI
ncbi:hypothetical protein [Enterococcus sp. N249-2]